MTTIVGTTPRPDHSTSALPARCPAGNAATRSRSPPEFACAECFGPLEVAYDFPPVSREDIEAGPKSIWRYRNLLPVPTDVTQHPNTEPGLTRLIRADKLAAALGLRSLWVKDDTGNPTHSFKDRVVAVALAAARELGFRVLACPSTGNLANAVAAAAARAGWDSVVLIPSSLERAKVLTTAVYDGDADRGRRQLRRRQPARHRTRRRSTRTGRS